MRGLVQKLLNITSISIPTPTKNVVFRNYIPSFMAMSWRLSAIHQAARSKIRNSENIPVKSKDSIFELLELVQIDIAFLSNQISELVPVSKEMKREIRKLNKKYVGVKKNEGYLDIDDARILFDKTLEWNDKLAQSYEKPATVLIDLLKLSEEINELSRKQNKIFQDDLRDVYLCLGHGISTPAVMMMNRAGEYMVKRFYKKIMGKPPSPKKPWGELEKEIRTKLPENDPILGLLQHRRSKRNDVQHPKDRYTQKEAEKNFFQIQELVEEIQKRLKKK